METPKRLMEMLNDPALDNVEKLTWLSEQDFDTDRLGRLLLTIGEFCRGCRSMDSPLICPEHYTGNSRTRGLVGRYRCPIHGEWTISYNADWVTDIADGRVWLS